MKEEVSNRVTDNPKTMEKIEDEIADILIFLLRVVDKTNIDLGKAVYNKMKKNAEKYPVELARGNAKKYSDFE
jgi:dCTP diphosphatase